MHDPRPRIVIVICPVYPFWRTGRPVWKHSTGAHLAFSPWWRATQAGPLIISAVSVPVMTRGPSSEWALRRGPSYDLPLSHSWHAARAGPLRIGLSCSGAWPVLGASTLQAAQLSFPFMLDFRASRPVCKRAPRAGGRLLILSRMVKHAVTSIPKTTKCARVSLQVNFFINCDSQKRFSQKEKRRADLQNFASDFLFFAWGLYELSKLSSLKVLWWLISRFFDVEGP